MLKKISLSLISQLLIQLISFISGLIIIRSLTINDYAIYTFVSSFLGTLVIIADGGVTNAVMSMMAENINNEKAKNEIFNTGYNFIKKTFLVVSLILLPILVYFLFNKNVSIIHIVLITGVLFWSFYITVKNNLLLVVLKLDEQIIYIQKHQFIANILKILVTPLIIFYPLVFFAMLLNSVVVFFNNISFSQYVKGKMLLFGEIDLKVKNKIVKILKKSLPTNIYYCFSSQITIWIVSFMGTTQHLATIGAIGRFTILLSVVSIVFSQMVVPKFALIQNTSQNINNLIFFVNKTLIISISFMIFILLGVYLFSDLIYYILGSKYEHNVDVLLLIVLGACLGLLSGLIYSLYISKGWYIDPKISISINLVSLIIGVLIIDTHNLYHVLMMNIGLIMVQIMMNVIFIKNKIKKL